MPAIENIALVVVQCCAEKITQRLDCTPVLGACGSSIASPCAAAGEALRLRAPVDDFLLASSDAPVATRATVTSRALSTEPVSYLPLNGHTEMVQHLQRPLSTHIHTHTHTRMQ